LKLKEIFDVKTPKKKIKIKRSFVKNTGNDKIFYLGTDAIQRSFSDNQK